MHLIDAEEEEPPFMATLRTFSENFFLMKHFPILITLSEKIPNSWSEWLLPGDHQFRRVSIFPYLSLSDVFSVFGL